MPEQTLRDHGRGGRVPANSRTEHLRHREHEVPLRRGRRYDFDSFRAFVERAAPSGAAVQTRPLHGTGASMFRIHAGQALPDPAVPELALHLLTAGELRYAADFSFGRFEGLKRVGDVDVVPPGTRGMFEAEGPFELLSLTIPWARVQEMAEASGCGPLTDLGPLHGRMISCPTIEHLLARLWQGAAEGGALGAAFADAGLSALIAHLLMLAGHQGQGAEQEALAKGGLAGWQVKRVREYVEEHLAEPLAVARLAELCRLSPFHFARAFHQSLGQPPHAYVTGRRIDRAKRLLEETEASITDISLSVGYAEPSHFARLFKRAHGIGPAEYRRRLG